MSWHVYVLESQLDRNLYTGITQDVASRLKRHNAGGVASTRRRRPFILVGSRRFGSFAKARQTELMLKQWKDPDRVRTWIAVQGRCYSRTAPQTQAFTKGGPGWNS